MQLPLIKDGLVVNVVEIGVTTLCVDKGTHCRMTAEEDSAYQHRAQEWREAVKAHNAAITQAKMQHFMVSGMAATVKAEARKRQGDAAETLDRILVADAEVEAWAAKVADMEAQAGPGKPAMERQLRWIYPYGHFVGPAGGNIGDLWDGKSYTSPKGKTAPERKTSEKVDA